MRRRRRDHDSGRFDAVDIRKILLDVSFPLRGDGPLVRFLTVAAVQFIQNIHAFIKSQLAPEIAIVVSAGVMETPGNEGVFRCGAGIKPHTDNYREAESCKTEESFKRQEISDLYD